MPTAQKLLFEDDAGAGLPVVGIERQKAFVLGGHAIFTLVSKASGVRFTFKIVRADERPGQPDERRPYFVSVLAGTDNENDYNYFGCLWPAPSTPRFVHGSKSRLSPDAPSVKAFAWFWKRIETARPIEGDAEFYHEGRCCRCGRRLTVPESIVSGIGPECAKRVGVKR